MDIRAYARALRYLRRGQGDQTSVKRYNFDVLPVVFTVLAVALCFAPEKLSDLLFNEAGYAMVRALAYTDARIPPYAPHAGAYLVFF